jgi:hypothetical protein
MVNGMPRTEYVRCTNPRCGKLNPVQAEEEGMEHTCVFCGQLFTPPAKAAQDDKASFKKRNRGKKLLNPSATRPENRNTRKPNI